MPIPVIGLLVRGAALGFGIALGVHAGRKLAPSLDEAAEDLDIGVKADHDDNPYYTNLFGEDPPEAEDGRRRH